MVEAYSISQQNITVDLDKNQGKSLLNQSFNYNSSVIQTRNKGEAY